MAPSAHVSSSSRRSTLAERSLARGAPVEPVMARVHASQVADAAGFARGRPAVNDLVVAGVVAGLLAGAAMLACAAVGAVMAELPPSRPLALAAAMLTGGDAQDAGAGAVAAGGLLWAIVSVALALPYASLLPRDFPLVAAAVVGASYAFVAMAVVTSVVLPRVNPAMRAGMTEFGGAWVLAYAVFGIGLGLIPTLRRRLASR
jgi:hypothetical protein